MDAVIAIAVGVPGVILAAIAVWYAKRNDTFQKMKLLMKGHRVHNGNQEYGHHNRAGGYSRGAMQSREPYKPGFAESRATYY